jgi:uncharacterized cupredoxin-like copper-binding protein
MLRTRAAAITLSLLLGACANADRGGPDVDWSRADEVDVRLVDFRFEPPEIVLEHGKPYRLHLENVGQQLHEFTAPGFFTAARVRDADTVLSRERPEVVVEPGRSRDVDLVAPGPGTYDLFCADHREAGMRGRIVVR